MLSIIIPYYKITFFDDTLKSLSSQTIKDFHVFIGDDCSKESPLKLLENYKDKFKFDYFKFDSNVGGNNLVEQWERCINLDSTSNKWLMILGDDDVLSENVVEEFYKQKCNFEDNINVVRFATVKINSKGEETSNYFYNPIIEKATDFLFRETRSSLSEYIFNKECLLKNKIKKFPFAWHSDVLAVLEVSNFNEIYSINNANLKIRISEESISGNSKIMTSKLNATFQFYYYLLHKKNKFFTKSQKLILLQKLKNCYFHRKKSLINFLKISYIQLRYFPIKFFFIFLNTFLAKLASK